MVRWGEQEARRSEREAKRGRKRKKTIREPDGDPREENEMELNQSQQQVQTLTPQMARTLSVIQMGVQELRDHVEEAMQENPVLELPETAAVSDGEARRERIEWVESDDRQNSYYLKQDREDYSIDAMGYVNEEEELSRYLLSQFQGMGLEEEVMSAVEFLIERLDPSGFLDEDPEELALLAGVEQAVMDRALIELRSADPAGVGAQNMAECLLLQLERRSGGEPVAREIIQNHMDDLAHGRYGRMARMLEVDEEEIRNAAAVVKSLNPRPATGFASRENLAYITPDMEILSYSDHFEIRSNDWIVPKLQLSDYYRRLLKETDDEQVKKYLREKIKSARDLMDDIGRRGNALMRCTQLLVEAQENFFRYGPGYIRPLSMQNIADKMGVHASTVSRTVRDKYFQCRWGIYPMAYLFSRTAGQSGDVSVVGLKELIRKLLEEEGDAPLSDQRISEELAKKGFDVARRTVAKYRCELGYPAASKRK